ncbi:unnamed protein product, partial [Iphiclides podalirius]
MGRLVRRRVNSGSLKKRIPLATSYGLIPKQTEASLSSLHFKIADPGTGFNKGRPVFALPHGTSQFRARSAHELRK